MVPAPYGYTDYLSAMNSAVREMDPRSAAAGVLPNCPVRTQMIPRVRVAGVTYSGAYRGKKLGSGSQVTSAAGSTPRPRYVLTISFTHGLNPGRNAP